MTFMNGVARVPSLRLELRLHNLREVGSGKQRTGTGFPFGLEKSSGRWTDRGVSAASHTCWCPSSCHVWSDDRLLSGYLRIAEEGTYYISLKEELSTWTGQTQRHRSPGASGSKLVLQSKKGPT